MPSILNLDLISDNDAIVIAVSGGVDSMVLLDALCELKESLHLKLTVAHVNHQVRAVSEEEYAFVENRCRDYGIPFEGMTLEPSEEGNFHQYARNRRYAFFYEVAKKTQSTKIALAHHADDQAETVLMRLTRGSGFIGYAGMSAVTPYEEISLIRPLLETTKKAIVSYQKKHALPFRQDASNEEDHYTRNRFRHHILPLIEKEDPKYREKIGQFSMYVSEAYHLIDRLATEYIASSVLYSDGMAEFAIKSFQTLDRIVAIDVVKKIIDRLTDNSLEIRFTHIQSTLRLMDNPNPSAQITLDKTMRIQRRYDTVRFQTAIVPKPLVFQVISGFGTVPLANGDTVIITENPCDMDGFSVELWYNMLDLVFPVTVRSRKAGDRIRLSAGTKKIADLLIDLKVPRDERDHILVVLNAQGEIVWVPGYKIGTIAREGNQKIYIHYVRGK